MSPDRKELRLLQRELRSEDPVVRQAALERAGLVIDETVAAVLTQALASDSPEVREKAVALLDRLLPETSE